MVPVSRMNVWALPPRSRVAPGLRTIEVDDGRVLTPPLRTTVPAWMVVKPAEPANCWALKISVPSRSLCRPRVVFTEEPLTVRVEPAGTRKLGIVAPELMRTPAPMVELPVASSMPEPERLRVCKPPKEPMVALDNLRALTWARPARLVLVVWLKRAEVPAASREPAVR